MKTIIALWNSADKGKTETLREFANLLLITYPAYRLIHPIPLSISATYDFRLVVEINGKIIGVESQGDPNTKLDARLIELADGFACDIILCTTRTRGDTTYAVDNMVSKKGFKSIWTSTYQIDGKASQTLANGLKAKHILDLLVNLSLL
jgi:hypothetical protein